MHLKEFVENQTHVDVDECMNSSVCSCRSDSIPEQVRTDQPEPFYSPQTVIR